MKFENRIQRSRHVLTKMDKKIIEYIQTHELDENFSTINSLAYAIGTSPATITRFSGKLNYANFQDMKFNLQHEKSEKSSRKCTACSAHSSISSKYYPTNG